MSNRALKTTLFICALFACMASHAKDFGTKGPTYPVQEQNMLDKITQKLASLEKSGELYKIQQEMIDATKINVVKPVSFNALPRAVKNRDCYFDPSFTLDKDIYNAGGVKVAKKGATVNPLQYVNLQQDLIFIDADDKKQIEYIQRILKASQHSPKIVLTNGNIKDAAKDLDKAIYFDQKGLLVNRFKIKNLPAIITQENYRLKIMERAP